MTSAPTFALKEALNLWRFLVAAPSRSSISDRSLLTTLCAVVERALIVSAMTSHDDMGGALCIYELSLLALLD